MEQLTIIVPVYNVEKYLEECLESIRNQTFTNFKVLMFNDGSTDSSPEILKRYQDLDNRFIFIDKENEGYGATCNRGLDMAETEWVAIVEPDDFIAPDMYEALLLTAHSDGDNSDLIKGSYWEYFEPTEDFDDALRIPNISRILPKRRKQGTIDDLINLLVVHPSVWSGIYRSTFLNTNDIRFIEAKGAGWVDNLFSLSAYVLARKITWTPKKNYYYRLTNEQSSSYLQDYHVPFDRMREMRDFIAKQAPSRKVIGAFYSRELDYIDQVSNKHGFDSSNVELNNLIREVLTPMDESIVNSDPLIPPKFRNFYMDFMGAAQEIKAHSKELSPKLSIIIPLHNQRDYVIPALIKILKTTNFPYEIVAVDCNSTDRTASAIEQLSKKDKRLSLIRIKSKNPADGMNVGIKSAIGDYISFAEVSTEIKMNELPEILQYAHASQAVNVQCGIDNDLAEELRLMAESRQGKVKMLNLKRYVFSTTANHIRSFYMRLRKPNLGNSLYLRSFLVENSITAGSEDGSTEIVLAARLFSLLLRKKQTTLAMTRSIRGTKVNLPVGLPFYRQSFYKVDDLSPKAKAPAAIASRELLQADSSILDIENSLKNQILEAFSEDLHSRLTLEQLNSYLKDVWPSVLHSIGKSTALSLGSEAAWNEYQRLKHDENGSFFHYLYMQILKDQKKARDSEHDVRNSVSYRLGHKIVDLSRGMTPRRVIATVRKEILRKSR